MPRLKRSLAPRFDPEPCSVSAGPVPPLREGFAIPRDSQGKPRSPERRVPGTPGGEPRPYGRGSASDALRHMEDPGKCREALRADISAATTSGPVASRRKLWSELAIKAGHQDPFYLNTDMILSVMGALKLANFRSSQLYLDTAKQAHIAEGHPWTSQLQQCYRSSIRSCNRFLGSPKQASPLPLLQLKDFESQSIAVKGGPMWPGRATILASWWLLREREASHALRKHIEVDLISMKVSWRLPSSKTDWKALGAVRSHRCACEHMDARLCPFHCMVKHLQQIGQAEDSPIFPTSDGSPASKTGWADTFQWLASQLGLDIRYQNGARKFTGHSARATGAVHLASTQV